MIRRFLKRVENLPWLLSGVLLFACYPPVSKCMYIVFALVPLLWMVRHKDPRFALKWGFLSGLVYWFATLRWMSALKDTGGPVLLVLLGWAALAAYCALYFGLFGWLAAHVWTWVRPRHPAWRLAAILVAEPVLWAGLELVRSRLLTGFAWNHLGTVPVVMGFGAAAALGGVYLLSMLVVLVNGSVTSVLDRIVTAYVEMRRQREALDAADDTADTVLARRQDPVVPRWLRSVETLVPFVLVLGVHLAAKSSVATHISSGDTLPVALFQRNFPPPFTDAQRRLGGEKDSPYQIYMEMAAAVKPLKPTLLVMSESAMCEFAGDVNDARAKLVAERLMDASGATAVIAGGSRGPFEGPLYNCAARFERDQTLQTYDKVHLVPFGEYIPGDKLIPALKALAPVGSCTPGEVRTLEVTLKSKFPEFPDQTVPLGVGICFEDTDSALMRKFAENGARALVFITNDSWFYGSSEPEQHAWQAVARAIETGLPVVRCGNYGVTGTIDPHGAEGRQCRASWLVNADGTLKINARERMVCDVPLASGVAELSRTPYVRYGDKPLLGAFLLLILTVGVIKYRHDYEKRRKLPL